MEENIIATVALVIAIAGAIVHCSLLKPKLVLFEDLDDEMMIRLSDLDYIDQVDEKPG
jgi:hypothetical protein